MSVTVEALFSVNAETIKRRIKRSKTAKLAYSRLNVTELDGKTKVIGAREDVGIFTEKIEVSLGENWLIYLQLHHPNVTREGVEQ
jgi:hypothetical protein